MNSRRAAILLWFGGGALFAWIVLAQDWGRLGPALAGTGWGLVAIAAFHLLPLLADTRAWDCLLRAAPVRPAFARLCWMRWLGESVNSLLPAAQVGGDLLRGRLSQRAGVPGVLAAAVILVDLTLSVATLVPFILTGVLLAWLGAPQAATLTSLAGGLLLGAAGLGGFVLLQHSGLVGRLLARLAQLLGGNAFERGAVTAASLNDAITGLYRRPALAWRSAGWALLAWFLGAGEVWLALHFLGVDAGWREALVLEALFQAIRNAAFLVPGALGVQDGGIMLVAALAGVGPESALLVSLLKRGRELLLGLPGLLAAWLTLAAERGAGHLTADR